MEALIVSVDYADILAITLPYNLEQFSRIAVVTSTTDSATAAVVAEHKCQLVTTDVFYENDKQFNKFAAMEHAISLMDPKGWMCFLDADILIPKNCIRLEHWRRGRIYNPKRRMWYDLSVPYPPESEWHTLPYGSPAVGKMMAGYMQVFHTEDPVLRSRPWHRLDYDNASDGDTDFGRKWVKERRKRSSFEVLHLGQEQRNWCGRVTPYVDGTVPTEALGRDIAVREFFLHREKKKK